MHPQAAEAIVASVRRREKQGDFPDEPKHGYEVLEDCILELAGQLEAAQAVAPPKERSLEAQRIAESAWPPRDVVTRLVECADILFEKHDYDGDGWEVLHSARAVARKWLASSPAAPATPAPSGEITEEMVSVLNEAVLNRPSAFGSSIRIAQELRDVLYRMVIAPNRAGCSAAPATPSTLFSPHLMCTTCGHSQGEHQTLDWRTWTRCRSPNCACEGFTLGGKSSPSGASRTEEGQDDLTAEALSVQLDEMASECESSAAQARGLRESESQINAYLDDALRFRKTAMYLRSYVSLLAEASAPAGEEPPKHWRDSSVVRDGIDGLIRDRVFANTLNEGTHRAILEKLCDDVAAALHSRSPEVK